jgi:hypothetical protein
MKLSTGVLVMILQSCLEQRRPWLYVVNKIKRDFPDYEYFNEHYDFIKKNYEIKLFVYQEQRSRYNKVAA